MRIVGWLLAVLGLALVTWMVFGDEPAPDAVETEDATPTETDAPTLESGATPPGEKEPEPPLDPEVFFARIEGKTGEALRLAVAEDGARRLPARADVVDRIMQVIQSLAFGDRAHGVLYRRLLGMGPEAIPLLEPYLEGDDARAKDVVFYLLGEWLRADPTLRIPDLLPHLEDPETRGRALVALQHGSPFDPALRDRLVELAPTDFMAAQALMRMGEPAFDDFLALFSTAADEEVLQRYYNLCYELDAAKRARAMTVLRAGVRHPNTSIANTALLVLRGLGPDAAPAMPEIRSALTSDRLGVVPGLLALVADIGPPAAAAVDDVLPWIEDEDPAISEAAALALGAISQGQPRVREALVRAIRENASDAAGQALAAFGAEGLDEAVRMILGDDEDARYAALWTLAKLGPAAAPAVKHLVPLVAQEDDVLLRQRAIGTAGFIGPKADAVVPAIMQALRSEVMPLIASDASASMVLLGSRARTALRDGLRAKDRITQLRSAEMLQAFRGTSHFALDELEPLLGSKDAELRRAALLAMRIAILFPVKEGQSAPALFDKALHARLRPLFERMAKDERRDIGAFATEALTFLEHMDSHIEAHRLTR